MTQANRIEALKYALQSRRDCSGHGLRFDVRAALEPMLAKGEETLVRQVIQSMGGEEAVRQAAWEVEASVVQGHYSLNVFGRSQRMDAVLVAVPLLPFATTFCQQSLNEPELAQLERTLLRHNDLGSMDTVRFHPAILDLQDMLDCSLTEVGKLRDRLFQDLFAEPIAPKRLTDQFGSRRTVYWRHDQAADKKSVPMVIGLAIGQHEASSPLIAQTWEAQQADTDAIGQHWHSLAHAAQCLGHELHLPRPDRQNGYRHTLRALPPQHFICARERAQRMKAIQHLYDFVNGVFDNLPRRRRFVVSFTLNPDTGADALIEIFDRNGHGWSQHAYFAEYPKQVPGWLLSDMIRQNARNKRFQLFGEADRALTMAWPPATGRKLVPTWQSIDDAQRGRPKVNSARHAPGQPEESREYQIAQENR